MEKYSETKKCPFCAEEIKFEAIKCRFCGEMMDGEVKGKKPWYFKTSILMMSVLIVGPFALPLLWINPNVSKTAKIVWTVVIFVATYLLSIGMTYLYGQLKEYMSIVMPV